MARSGRRAKRGSGLTGRLRRVLLSLLAILILGPPLWVLIYRWVPPPITVLMVQRLFEGKGLDRRWVSIDRISPELVRGVIAAEDSHFCAHDGFDAKAIEAALRHNQDKPGKVRGGSTISQQTAKNVFLWPQRSWVRKGAEVGFTVLIEHLWGKRRIMEVYLNTVEMGPGVYGAEAASRRYFHVSARELSPDQASRLAAILPSPLKWKPVRAGPYVRRRSGRIEAGSETVEAAGLAACVLPSD